MGFGNWTVPIFVLSPTMSAKLGMCPFAQLTINAASLLKVEKVVQPENNIHSIHKERVSTKRKRKWDGAKEQSKNDVIRTW